MYLEGPHSVCSGAVEKEKISPLPLPTGASLPAVPSQLEKLLPLYFSQGREPPSQQAWEDEGDESKAALIRIYTSTFNTFNNFGSVIQA